MTQPEHQMGDWSHRVLDALPYAAILTDAAAGTITGWNRGAEQLYGWTAAEALGKSILEILVPHQEQAAVILATLRLGRTWSGNFPVQRRDGSQVTAHVRDIPILNADGEVEAILGLSSVATDQLIFEETFDLAMQAGRLGAWEWDEGSGQVSWSSSLEAAYGLAPGEFAGTFEDFVARVYPDDRERILSEISTAMDQQAELHFEYRILRADGELRWFEARGEPVVDASGARRGMRGVAVDIDERKQAETLAATRERQHAAIADLGRAALTGRDVQLLCERAVAVVTETLGVEFARVVDARDPQVRLTIRAAVGWQAGVVGATADNEGLDQARYTLRINGPVVMDDIATETRFTPPQVYIDHGIVSGMSMVIRGRTQPWGVLAAHTSVRRQFSDDDVYFLRSVANVLGLALDAHEATQIREDFISLASHELRNPLTTINGFASLLERRVRGLGEPQLSESVDFIVRESRKMVTTLQSLVDLARLDSDELRIDTDEVDLVTLVAAEVSGLRMRHPLVTTVEQYAQPSVQIQSDPNRVSQIIANLLDNAVKYGGEPGRVTVTVGSPAEGVEVTVRDDGPGIAPDDLGRVFERFYRGAGAARAGGSGLGLYISRQIATRLGARLSCSSTPGEGAAFTLQFPSTSAG